MIRQLLFAYATIGIATAHAGPATDNATLPNCNAVNNLYSIEFVYSTPTSATVKYIEQTTVLNRSGNGKADFTCYVSPTIDLKNFAGTISDAQGKVIRKLKRTDLKYTEFSTSLAQDDAVYFLECLSPTYPYTVRVEYELAMKNGILGFPSFIPVASTDTALEKGTYSISVPQGTPFGYKCRNIGEPVRNDVPGRDIYSWTIEHFPSVKSEPALPPLLELVPQVFSVPGDFEYEGTRGSMRDWASYGNWMCGLLSNRGTLPEALKQEVHRRTDTLSTAREKVRVLYDYLGESTRYVSIQLGIGGQRPMMAEEVFRTKFGDCKALSNYLSAMLTECGIKSDYAILHTNRRRMHRDFASPAQANHAILRVPLKNDTLWLECTNPDVPFGHVHNNIAGHDAIVFHDGTGEFVTLPQYADSLNRMVCEVTLSLGEDGTAQGHITTCYEGAQYDQMMSFMKLETKKQTDWLLDDLKIPMSRIENINCNKESTPGPRFEVNFDISSQRYFSLSGNRCFLPQTPFHDYSPSKDRVRLNNIYYAQGYQDITRVKLRIPENMQIESLPKTCCITMPFGAYSLQTSASDGIITVEQRICIYKGTYPRDQFEQYRNFMTERAKTFNTNIVLKK